MNCSDDAGTVLPTQTLLKSDEFLTGIRYSLEYAWPVSAQEFQARSVHK